MVDLLQKSAPAEPIRICPACGDVLVAGFCPACAPPPARSYAERGSRTTAIFSAGGRAPITPSPVDSRRAASEWIVGPEELDPQTRKAHPSQLRTTRPVVYEAPEPVRKRTTQVYRQKSGPIAPVADDVSRPWALPEPRMEADAPQSAATARHSRPLSPARPASGPVVLEPAAPPVLVPALVAAPPVLVPALVVAPPVLAPVEFAPTTSEALEDELSVTRPVFPRAAWLLLAVGILAGVVVALV